MPTEPHPNLPERYEIVNGQIIEKPFATAYASEVANRLCVELTTYGRNLNVGRPNLCMLFYMPLPNDLTRCRHPSLSFCSFERWPDNRPVDYRAEAIECIPELMVEVANPTDGAEEFVDKLHEYFEAGVQLVWLVYPRRRVIYAHESPTSSRVFPATDELEGGNVLPGFRVAVASLFPPMMG
jgi:Uma2 family endonuclease